MDRCSPPQGHLESFWGPQEGPPPSPAQVQEEFKQNMENIGVETLLRNFAESKGTGCHPPGERPWHPWAAFGVLCSRPRALLVGGLCSRDRWKGRGWVDAG